MSLFSPILPGDVLILFLELPLRDTFSLGHNRGDIRKFLNSLSKPLSERPLRFVSRGSNEFLSGYHLPKLLFIKLKTINFDMVGERAFTKYIEISRNRLKRGENWRALDLTAHTVKFREKRPGAYIFQRPFSRGLFLEGLIFGGAYLWTEICVSKSIGLAL